MRKIVIISFLLFAGFYNQAQQPFEKVVWHPGYDFLKSVDIYNNGHILSGNIPNPSNYYGAYLLKTDNNGNELWNKIFSFAPYTNGDYVLASSDGGFVLTGRTGDFNGNDSTYILKTDAAGNLLWSKIFYYGQGEECFPTSVMQTADSGFVVTGSYYDQVNFSNDAPFLFKVDKNGNLLWAKTYDDGINSYIYANDVIEDAQGNLYIAGKNHYFLEGPVLLKTNSTGNLLWTKVYRSPNLSFIFPVQLSQRADNSLDIIYTEKYSAQQNQMLLIHADDSGTLLDAKYFSVTNSTGTFTQFEKITDTEIAACGQFSSPGGFGSEALLMKANLSTGNVSWTNIYGSEGYEGANDVSIDANGNPVLVGYTQVDSILQRMMGGLITDGYYLRTDVNGQVACNVTSITAVSVPHIMSDSVEVLIETDILSASYFASSTPAIYNYFQDTLLCTGVGVDEVSNNLIQLNVFPDPASLQVTVEHSGNNNGLLTIMDISGKIIYQTIINEKSVPVNVSDFNNGMYIIRFTSEKGYLAKKLIVQH